MPSHLTGIDLNRAGTPLLEIVTTPCLHSAEEVIQYLKKLHQLVRFLDICDGNMEEGSFRCDVNISIKTVEAKSWALEQSLKTSTHFDLLKKQFTMRWRDKLT